MTIGNRNDDILLVTHEATVASTVEAALGANGRTWSWSVVHSIREMLAHLAASGARAVLVDLDSQPKQMLAELEHASARFPAARFVALATEFDQQMLLDAMQSGVRHILPKHQVSSELAALLHRLSNAGGMTPAPSGDLYVVLSAGGGCGASTLAVNIADELSTRSQKPTLMIDMDLCYGALAIMLGIEAKYGLGQVLWRSDVIDAHLIRSTAAPYTERLHLLAAPSGEGFLPEERLDLNRLGQMLDAAVQAYANVVIDAPRVPAAVAAMLTTVSTQTLLAMQLNVRDTRVARGMMAALAQHGVPQGSVTPLVMRYARRKHTVKLEDAARALGVPKLECIRSDYSRVARAIDYGQTLAVGAPRSVVRRDVRDLVSLIVAPRDPE